MQVYRGLLRGVQVVAVKVFNDGPQYTRDSSQERMQTLHALKLQRQTLIKQEIAVLKSCRDRNIVQFVGACIQVSLVNCVTLMYKRLLHECNLQTLLSPRDQARHTIAFLGLACQLQQYRTSCAVTTCSSCSP